MILKLTSPAMTGPMVTRLCELLDVPIKSRYDLELFDAVMQYQAAVGLNPDGVVGPKTWQSLLHDTLPIEDGSTFVNIVNKHPKPFYFAYQRPIEQVTGVMLHQTGCTMPLSPDRWGKVNAHIGVTGGGVVLLLNSITDMIWHGNSASPSTIGVEIAGLYPGIARAQVLSGGLLRAFDLLFKLLRGLLGSRWRYVYAHRQTSLMRRADPGETLWKATALRWKNCLGLQYGKTEGGLDIPKNWDSSCNAKY